MPFLYDLHRRCIPSVQKRIVVEPGDLIIRFAATKLDFYRAAVFQTSGNSSHPGGIGNQFVLAFHPLPHRRAQILHRGICRHVGQAVHYMMTLQQTTRLHIAEIQTSVRGQLRPAARQHALQIGGIRKILCHGMDEHQIETLLVHCAEVIRRRMLHAHSIPQFRHCGNMSLKFFHCRQGEIRADISLAMWCKSQQQLSRATANFQNPTWPQCFYASQRVPHPLLHLPFTFLAESPGTDHCVDAFQRTITLRNRACE